MGFVDLFRTSLGYASYIISRIAFYLFTNLHESQERCLLQVIPRHVAIIMDGNRRYGERYGKGKLTGHCSGADVFLNFVQWCSEYKVETLTAYAFSVENAKRSREEVTCIMNVFVSNSYRIKTEANDANVRVKFISTDISELPEYVKCEITAIEEFTCECTGMVLNVCMHYGGREEIVNATKEIAKLVRDGSLDIDDINPSVVTDVIRDNGGVMEPDLLIRTSEHRISNFLLWQIAYSEMIFLPKLWPELTKRDFIGILDEYNTRVRRFGR